MLQPFLAVFRLLREERVEADKVWQLLLVAQRNHALRCARRRESHHGLVDRPDRFNIERAIGQPLADLFSGKAAALDGHQSVQDAQDGSVRDGDHSCIREPAALLAAFQKRKAVGIE
jgi:hypothetical protein